MTIKYPGDIVGIIAIYQRHCTMCTGFSTFFLFLVKHLDKFQSLGIAHKLTKNVHHYIELLALF